jgi:hypothetical protein
MLHAPSIVKISKVQINTGFSGLRLDRVTPKRREFKQHASPTTLVRLLALLKLSQKSMVRGTRSICVKVNIEVKRREDDSVVRKLGGI